MKRFMLLGAMGIGLAALGAPPVISPSVHDGILVVYNPTDSVPRGWYRISRMGSNTSLHVGSIVLARLPVGVAPFAAQRGYLPSGVPILKRIGAVAPQPVCVRGRVLLIDGVAAGTLRTHDGAQLPLHGWSQCRPLADGEIFLLSDTNPASFDSRYFGPMDASAVLGVALPLWTWSGR